MPDLIPQNITLIRDKTVLSNGDLIFELSPEREQADSHLIYSVQATDQYHSEVHITVTPDCHYMILPTLVSRYRLDDALSFCNKSVFALVRFRCIDGDGEYIYPFTVETSSFWILNGGWRFIKRGPYYYMSNNNPRRYIAEVLDTDVVGRQDPEQLTSWHARLCDEARSSDDIPF